MKNCAMTLMLILALVFSSISLALSVSSMFSQEAKKPGSIPPQAFEGLGGKKGVGFGDWRVDNSNPSLTIFSYPAGTTAAGWDGYLQDMLITITVTLEETAAGNGVDITFSYLTGTKTIRLVGMGTATKQSTTFTEQIYEVKLTYVWISGTTYAAYGYYFVSADRRV